MNYSTYRFSLDLHSQVAQVSLPVVKGDTSRQLRISITDGKNPFILGEDCTAVLNANLANGSVHQGFFQIENGETLVYNFSDNKSIASAEGITKCDVVLYDGDDGILGSPKFNIIVTNRAINSDDIDISTSQQNAIDAMISREATRMNNETKRVNAEKSRVTAEQMRVDAEASRETRFVEMEEDVEYAIANIQNGKDGESVYVDSVTESYEDGGENFVSFSDGTSLIVRNGRRGQQGIQGERGIQGIQGVKGDDGKPFRISKTYASVSAMNAGYSTDGVEEGGFVLITTGNVEDEDNAKLYVKGASRYEYLTDMSGAQGVEGPQGPQGIQGIQGQQGVQGVKGDTGYTPVRGKDYWTPSDKSEVIADVLASLPYAEGVEF